jgi:hypothetical protein
MTYGPRKMFESPAPLMDTSEWLLTSKKVHFEPEKHIFDQNSHFWALNNP